MAGSTTNENFLAAINELIAAVNENQSGNPDVLLPSLSDITDAIAAIAIDCPDPQVDIEVTCRGPGNEPDVPVSADDEPAPGDEPDPEITDRKCRASNFLTDVYIDIFDRLNVDNVDTYADVSIVLCATLISASIGSVAPGLGTSIGAVGGAVLGAMVALLIETDVVLEDIKDVLSNNRMDFVCAFAEAQSTSEARSEWAELALSAGMTLPETQLLQLVMPHRYLRVLFQAVGNSETLLANYTPTTDCGASCGGSCGHYSTYVEPLSDDGSEVSGSSSPEFSAHWFDVAFNSEDYSTSCGDRVTVDSIQTTGFSPASPAGYRLYSTLDNSGLVYSGNSPPAGPVSDVRKIILKSTTAFTATVEYS